MTRAINFIRGSWGDSNIIHSIVTPIRKYLPDSSDIAMNDAVNVHFFNEPKYREQIAWEQREYVP